MPASVPPGIFHVAAARAYVVGALAGQALLLICLLENVSNLGYAVLNGSVWTVLGLVGAFGLCSGTLAASITLALAALGSPQPVLHPARSHQRGSRTQTPRP